MTASPTAEPSRARPEHEAARAADLASSTGVSRTVDSDGHAIHVLSYPGEGPATIVIPGITSAAITWDFVARELADVAQLNVVDLRGRGLSDRSVDYSTTACARDVAAIALALGLDRPVLLGHSLGARIAAKAAIAQPELARALILIEPPMSGPDRPYPMTLEQFVSQLHAAYAGTTAEEVAAIWPGWPPAEHELRARWLDTVSEESVVQTHAGFESEEFLDDWPRLAAPLTFVHGVNSKVVTAEDVVTLGERNGAAGFVAIADAAHMQPWENPAGFLDAIRPLLRAAGER